MIGRVARARGRASQILWSALAERSGDGVLDSEGLNRSKAVSRFACHRTPKGLSPKLFSGPGPVVAQNSRERAIRE